MPETLANYLSLRLTPQGHLLLEHSDDAPALDEALAQRLVKAFGRGSGYGLLQMGGGEVGGVLPPILAWWRDFAGKYVTARCLQASGGAQANHHSVGLPIAPPDDAQFDLLVLTAPMMTGAEYLHQDVMRGCWTDLDEAFTNELAAANSDLQTYLTALNPSWNVVGRVHFNLAENKKDPAFPFAFMATYAAGISANGKPRHLPLSQALQEYAGPRNRDRLLALLTPVQRAAKACTWLKTIVDSGDIFHPLRWTPDDAARLLGDVGVLEQAGLILRMPPTWHAQRPSRPRVTATVGTQAPSVVGLDALLDFRLGVTLEDEELTADELRTLLAGTDSLVLLRGQWVEINRKRLEQTMQVFADAQKLAQQRGLTFAQAMRMLAGADISDDMKDSVVADWSSVRAGPWLAQTLEQLRGTGHTDVDPGSDFQGNLRPYQRAGVRWMRLLSGLGLGACLADDMGLGKTIQVLCVLLLERKSLSRSPSLLVVPASLMANWMAEIERFAPVINAKIVHPSAMTAAELKNLAAVDLSALDVIVTTYGSLLRIPVISEYAWNLVILDEAQAIKNSAAKQTGAVKRLRAKSRIALTGTPVENHLGDLWSIFDFINPGLLGNAKQFSRYTKKLAERTYNPFGPLRQVVSPYILRRMKTDRTIISDLPDKTEVKAYCTLSRKQAALYAQTVAQLEDSLRNTDGIARKGVVLATLMRLKQICNHPSQWLGDGTWDEGESGKFARLREIATVVAEKQEKMLVFTQFREMTAPLEMFLGGIFGHAGLMIHGDTPVKQRQELVRTFQSDESVPFFILSLKAGGSGLTLTAASHVVHFDRWWNPAVENQATDRAFRIGQKRNVLVHKFICRGTIEEKVDELIESKKQLSDNLLAGGAEVNMTELSDGELLRLIALDLDATMRD